MRGFVIAVVVAVLVMGLSLEVSAAIPRLVNYQGIVTDSGGLPITGPHNLTFRIYADSAQSSPVLWTEVHSGVPISQGLFNVILGGTTVLPDSLFGTSPRWMGVAVDVDGEMTPRMQLTSVPWAFRTALAESSATLPAHAHDDRYYTESELNTTGTINTPTNPVDWTKLKSVPSGFADGTDDIGGGINGWVISGNNEQSNVSGNVGIGTAPAANLRLHVVNPADTANATAVYGEVSSPGTTAFHDGVWGVSRGRGTGAGVFGQALGGEGSVNGVSGSTNCPTGRGVQGGASSPTGVNYGVSGYTASASGYAGYFQGQATGFSGYFIGGKNYFEGNVGIGTATPSVKLDVAGTVKMTGLSLPTGAANNYVLTSDSSGTGTWKAATGGGGAGWTITNGGNDEYASVPGSVAIGTPTPNSLYRLYVENQSSTDNAKAIYGVATSTTSVGRWLCGVGGETRCTNLNDLSYGVIGLATADSGKGVGVYGYSAASSGIGVFGSVAKPSAFAGYFLGGKSYFEGNVGIGTRSPLATLDVMSSATADTSKAISGIQTATAGRFSCGVYGETNSTSDMWPGRGVWGNDNATSGYGVGVYGSASSPHGSAGVFRNDAGGWAGYFATGKSFFGGNVGIGTASPGEKLHVVGNAFFNGSVGMGSEGPNTAHVLHVVDGAGTYGTHAIYALQASTNGNNHYGVCGQTLSASAAGRGDCAGVRGLCSADSGAASGVYGSTATPSGAGVYGVTTYGSSASLGQSAGVFGICAQSSGYGMGVYGETSAASGAGVCGWGGSSTGYSAYFDGVGGSKNYFGRAVGIGTTNPQALLDVAGTARVQVLEITGADVAEKFSVNEAAEPGTVVAIDPEQSGQLCVAQGEYNRCVAGVISGAGDLPTGAIMGNLPGHEKGLPVALTGRVWVKCDASKQPIELGDLLTTSDHPGLAMKVGDYTRAQGAIIGKAMTALSGGEGLVLALVSLQ